MSNMLTQTTMLRVMEQKNPPVEAWWTGSGVYEGLVTGEWGAAVCEGKSWIWGSENEGEGRGRRSWHKESKAGIKSQSFCCVSVCSSGLCVETPWLQREAFLGRQATCRPSCVFLQLKMSWRILELWTETFMCGKESVWSGLCRLHTGWIHTDTQIKIHTDTQIKIHTDTYTVTDTIEKTHLSKHRVDSKNSAGFSLLWKSWYNKTSLFFVLTEDVWV